MATKKYYQEHKKEILKKTKDYYSLPEVKAKRQAYTKKWRKNNQKKIKDYRKENKEKSRAYDKERRQKPEVKTRTKMTGKVWYQKNKEKVKEYHKKYSQLPDVKIRIQKWKKKYNYENREKISEQRKAYKKIYNKNNVLKINNYQKKKRRTNPEYRIKHNLRTLFNIALRKYSKTGKIMSSKKYGIDYKKIIEYLKPFPKNRENYDVDHIVPLSWFDLNNPKEIEWAFAPENHQWLLLGKNRSKNNRFMG